MQIELSEVSYEHGVRIRKKDKAVTLDPRRRCPNPVVSHAHTDHLAKDGIMTRPTKDIMKVRKNWDASIALDYGEALKLDGFDIEFMDAGHVLGSAMVMVDDILYTGDFNPEGGLTCGRAMPEKCRTLVVEATYGQRRYSLPDKDEVTRDMLSWIGSVLENDSVIIGGYEFGKAQEVVALANRHLGMEAYVPDSIADICDIYIKHGVDLRYRRLDEMWFEGSGEPRIIVLPSGWLRFKNQNYWKVLKEKKSGTKACYASGWCAFYNHGWQMDIDSEFPLSDHADFDDLLEFVAGCSPQKVYTVYGSSEELAGEIKKETGIDSEPLKGG